MKLDANPPRDNGGNLRISSLKGGPIRVFFELSNEIQPSPIKERGPSISEGLTKH